MEKDLREGKGFLKGILPISALISHIGSTSVKGIWAKPIVDILVEAPDEEAFYSCESALLANGYLCMDKTEKRASFNKGYTPSGYADKVFHLHLRFAGDNDELYFRDYLIDHPETAKEYETLKLSLWKEFEHGRDAYTEAKGEFVRRYTALAKRIYVKRH